MDWMCKCAYMSMFSLSLCFQWFYPHEDTFRHIFFLLSSAFTCNLLEKSEYMFLLMVSMFWIYPHRVIHAFELDMPTKSTWQMAWMRVFSPSRWGVFTAIKLAATFYFDIVDVVVAIFQWCFRFWFLFKHRLLSSGSIGWANERKSTAIILEILSCAKVKSLKCIHF